MDPSRLHWLSAADAARAVRDGMVSARDLVDSCLARVHEADAEVQAWAFIDPAHALEQARLLDELRAAGGSMGPLHGVPVGVKDIIDTTDMPTECGTPLHAGRIPDGDAGVVAMLRAAGAVIMGKTVTSELAGPSPGKTRNPHNAAHTPGGSSSGSAAAVAAGMVPLAIGTQSNGSVIRPAAFCGIYGFKPTHGLIPRHGIMKLSRALDQVGVFGRTLEDVALACEPLVGHDERDPDTRPRARIAFRDLAAEEPPLPPLLAFIKTSLWERAEEETRDAFTELVGEIEGRIVEIDIDTRAALDIHRTIMEADIAASLAQEYDHGRERLGAGLRAQLERGRTVSAFDYQNALARIPLLNDGFEQIFERCDAILTPAAAGAAPAGLESTGDPSFCTLWTLCGMPAITLPLLRAANGMPMGVQLVGRRNSDARLLRTAAWLTRQLATD